MSRIVIHIPDRKEWRYIGAEKKNAERAAGQTIGIAYAKAGLYNGALSGELQNFEQEDKLRVVDSNTSDADNELILRSDDGTTIYLIGVEIDVTQKNKVATTQLINRAGTVKERIQREDYEVKVHGNLIGGRDKFPHEDMKTLVTILNSTSSISCSSAYLDIFGISKLVLTQAKFDQKGLKYFNTLPLELTFNSDEDYSFLVQD